MKVLALVEGHADYEKGAMAKSEELAGVGRFTEELVKAGVMLAGGGLHPSWKAVRVSFEGEKPAVTDGPFAEAKELVAGYWLWQVKSMDEAVEWVKRIPNPEGTPDGEVEIRQVFEADDFGEQLTPELREQEARLRAQTDANA